MRPFVGLSASSQLATPWRLPADFKQLNLVSGSPLFTSALGSQACWVEHLVLQVYFQCWKENFDTFWQGNDQSSPFAWIVFGGSKGAPQVPSSSFTVNGLYSIQQTTL
jgi:hypothetical protein